MIETHSAVRIFILLLIVASAVAMATKWVRVPYTLALVIVGLVISPMHFLPTVHVSPELILLIFLPALLFEASWNLKLDELRANLVPILVLAVGGVLLSVGVIGAFLHWVAGLPWIFALLFGSMISATDPVSVLALFRSLGLPGRLATIVESESLFNDGTAVVVFRFIVGFAAGATVLTPGGMVVESVRQFVVVVFGGVAVGAAVGLLASTLTSYFDDHLLEITLTTISAYGSFLLAEAVTASPVIAVLITGLVIGNYGRRVGMSPTTQIAVNSFWEYAAFVVNSLMFLLVGLEIRLSTVAASAGLVAWGVVAMLLARLAGVYLLVPVSNRFSEPVPRSWQHVLFWGGLRGSLSVALALSLPTAAPGRNELVVMVFGAVIFSLLAQGLSIGRLVGILHISRPSPVALEYEMVQGRILAAAAAQGELERLRGEGMISDPVFGMLNSDTGDARRRMASRLEELQQTHRELQDGQLKRVRQHLIDVQRSRLATLLRERIISGDTHRALNEELDRSAVEE